MEVAEMAAPALLPPKCQWLELPWLPPAHHYLIAQKLGCTKRQATSNLPQSSFLLSLLLGKSVAALFHEGWSRDGGCLASSAPRPGADRIAAPLPSESALPDLGSASPLAAHDQHLTITFASLNTSSSTRVLKKTKHHTTKTRQKYCKMPKQISPNDLW